jgi:hypothetical protein
MSCHRLFTEINKFTSLICKLVTVLPLRDVDNKICWPWSNIVIKWALYPLFSGRVRSEYFLLGNRKICFCSSSKSCKYGSLNSRHDYYKTTVLNSWELPGNLRLTGVTNLYPNSLKIILKIKWNYPNQIHLSIFQHHFFFPYVTDSIGFQPVFHLGEGSNTETQKLEKCDDENAKFHT